MARLLIVDDEADVREFGANFFRKRKIEVTTAGSGEEALALIEKQKPDLVLLDIKMNGIDGVETLKRIKNKNKGIKVVMVTGKDSDDDKSLEVCKGLGALDYIHKPLALDELEETVLKVLLK
ncbi:MAG: response regulator [Candidatus Omnitrophica bacterium]|nr:response regulator [Candidatus Omnitrophota bacterium]MBU4346739.1 response regulator [Candidatus Omnitrophota bacterium]MBU4473251.1 response regulator [Candidatus Omnitrophota bacterium]MCG2706055.1 response regulator [Candidatus Omnitrophota bacterium]